MTKPLFGDINPAWSNAFNETYVKGNPASMQLALQKLKDIGCSQLQSAKLLIALLGMSLREADKIVLHAEAWKNEKAANIAVREEFAKSLEEDNAGTDKDE
jgi:hypothetical protein